MERKRILILGGNGMLGHKLFFHLSNYENFEVFATVRRLDSIDKYLPSDLLNNLFINIDASNYESISKIINLTKPDIVINCIGIVKQSSLGQDPLSNIAINALLPHQIARTCYLAGIRMIHISTDCVFSGEKGNYTENDIPDAVDIYGRSKLLGEVNYSHTLTLRTSIIGHELGSRLGLLEWFLGQTDKVNGFTRHIFTGFPTIELARIIAKYIIPASHLTGIYHLSSEPISKYDLLQLVASTYGKSITIEPYENTCCDRSLNSERLRNIIGYSPPKWPDLINEMYEDYLASPYPKR